MKLGEAQVEALLAFVCDEVAKVYVLLPPSFAIRYGVYLKFSLFPHVDRSDLDPTWFKEYVGAMLAHDEPLGELEEMTRADLKDFLEDSTFFSCFC